MAHGASWGHIGTADGPKGCPAPQNQPSPRGVNRPARPPRRSKAISQSYCISRTRIRNGHKGSFLNTHINPRRSERFTNRGVGNPTLTDIV